LLTKIKLADKILCSQKFELADKNLNFTDNLELYLYFKDLETFWSKKLVNLNNLKKFYHFSKKLSFLKKISFIIQNLKFLAV
jgi:hypothetical protein